MAEIRLTRYGTPIGYISEGTGSNGEKRVMDAQRRTVGYINATATYDLGRRRVADYPDPALLLGQR